MATATVNKDMVYKNPSSGSYYLVLHRSEHEPEEFNKICNILYEYGTIIRSRDCPYIDGIGDALHWLPVRTGRESGGGCHCTWDECGHISPLYYGENTLYKNPSSGSYYLVLHRSEHEPEEFNLAKKAEG